MTARSRYIYICTCEECGELFESKIKSAVLCDSCRKALGAMEKSVLLPSERNGEMLDEALLFGACIADADGIDEDYSENMKYYWLQRDGLTIDGFTLVELDPIILRRQLVEEALA